jgi:virginiamycin A acetyltransferase
VLSLGKKLAQRIKNVIENRVLLRGNSSTSQKLHFEWLSDEKLSSLNLLSLNPKLARYEIGKFSYGDQPPAVLSFGGANSILKIGNYCSLAAGVTILLGGEHHPQWITTYPFNIVLEGVTTRKPNPYSKGNVIIGNDVWIGKNVLILSGVQIGDGAIVGASSVVTNDIEPYSIVAGNPAKLIRKRFDEETVEKLLKIKWWYWDLERIKKNMPLLLSSDIKEFLDENS